jgi:LmbE family N-acetylglucosaminyl deacetylase
MAVVDVDLRPAAFLFLSPHLDDAVFSCGELIACVGESAVATLFAGRPPPGSALTAWDFECGFRPGDDVVGRRRDEDGRALNVLHALPIWLDYCDDQYRCSPTLPDLVDALAALLAQHAFTDVLFPLGLFHTDHRRTSDAALPLVARFETIRWFLYEDAIYRRIPGLAEQRIASLIDRGLTLRRQAFSSAPAARTRKRKAIACYRSQIRALRSRPAYGDALAAEAYWRIERAAGAQ